MFSFDQIKEVAVTTRGALLSYGMLVPTVQITKKVDVQNNILHTLREVGHVG